VAVVAAVARMARYRPLVSGRSAPGNPTRVQDVEVTPTADGSVVYDQSRERVHYLNETAAAVLDLCTGDRSVEEIARLLQDAYGLAEPPFQAARDCVKRLSNEGLVR
jgi:hypothetical protein